jgi:hypothetical protein
MKEGTKEKISGSGGISLISSRLTLEGPIDKNSSFMLSVRRMYLDVLTWLGGAKDAPTYYFYDLNAKVNYKLSENDQVFLSGYFGRDRLAPSSNDINFKIDWGNGTGNLRWLHIVSPKLFTNFSLIFTDYTFLTEIKRTESSGINFYAKSGVQDLTLRSEAQYFPIENHTIKAGIEGVFHSFLSAATNIFSPDINSWTIDEDKKNAFEGSIYAQDEWEITPLLTSNIGGRLFYFQNGNYINFEPRLSLLYSLTDKIKLKASFAGANQFLHLVTRNDITLPTDLWFPSTEQIKPSKSLQAVIGAETTLGENNDYLVTLEGYYKTMDNLLEYKDSVTFSLGIPLESQFTKGSGNAYGIELFLNKRIGNLTGWIGYTLAWTKRNFPDLNNGLDFFPRYDRRHDVSVVLSYKLNDTWEIGASWVYGTGQAYTVPTGSYSFKDIGSYSEQAGWGFDIEGYQYTERNGFRLPPFHKLDLNFMYNYKWFNIPFQFSINIYNAYNNKNPFAWYINNDYNPDTQTSKKVLKQITLLPFIPTFGLSFKF